MMSCNSRTAGNKSAQRQLLQLAAAASAPVPLAKSNLSSPCLAAWRCFPQALMAKPGAMGWARGEAPVLHARTAQSAPVLGVASVGEGLDFRSLPWAHRSGSVEDWRPGSIGRSDFPSALQNVQRTTKQRCGGSEVTGYVGNVVCCTVPYRTHVSVNEAALSLPARLHARPDALWSRSKCQTEPHRWRQVPMTIIDANLDGASSQATRPDG